MTVFAGTGAEAASYYASPNGVGASCSASSPCSMQAAMDKAGPGDEVVLKDGRYYSTLSTKRHGAAGKPLTIRAENPHRAVISPPSGWDGGVGKITGDGKLAKPGENFIRHSSGDGGFVSILHDHITFSGLKLDGKMANGGMSFGLIHPQGNNMIIEGNIFVNAKGAHMGLGRGSDNVIIRHNIIGGEEAWSEGLYFRSKPENPNRNVQFYGNIVRGTPSNLLDIKEGGNDRFDVHHNIFEGQKNLANLRARDGCLLFGPSNSRFRDNIVRDSHCGTAPLGNIPTSSGSIITKNVFSNIQNRNGAAVRYKSSYNLAPAQIVDNLFCNVAGNKLCAGNGHTCTDNVPSGMVFARNQFSASASQCSSEEARILAEMKQLKAGGSAVGIIPGGPAPTPGAPPVTGSGISTNDGGFTFTGSGGAANPLPVTIGVVDKGGDAPPRTGAATLLQADFEGGPAHLINDTYANQIFGTGDNGTNIAESRNVAYVTTDDKHGQVMEVRFIPGAAQEASGVKLERSLSDRQEVMLSYDFRTADNFDPIKGGELPGLCGGSCPGMGEDPAGGFNARVMWRQNNRLALHLGYPNQPGANAQDFPLTHQFTKGAWTNVKQQVKVESAPGACDGEINVWINDQSSLALDKVCLPGKVSKLHVTAHYRDPVNTGTALRLDNIHVTSLDAGLAPAVSQSPYPPAPQVAVQGGTPLKMRNTNLRSRPDVPGPSSRQECAALPITVSNYQDLNPASYTRDNNLNTRWSMNGKGQWIQYDLGRVGPLDQIGIAWFRGDKRTAKFAVDVSSDGTTWYRVYEGSSSGNSNDIQTHDFKVPDSRFVRVVGYGNSQNDWAAVTEVAFDKALANGQAAGNASTCTPPVNSGGNDGLPPPPSSGGGNNSGGNTPTGLAGGGSCKASEFPAGVKVVTADNFETSKFTFNPQITKWSSSDGKLGFSGACYDYNVAVVDAPCADRKNNKAMRLISRMGDDGRNCKNRWNKQIMNPHTEQLYYKHRVEVDTKNAPVLYGKDWWVRMRIYVPEDFPDQISMGVGAKPNSGNQIMSVSQVIASQVSKPGTDYKLYLNSRNGPMRWSMEKIGDLGPVERGQWVEWVIHLKRSTGPDGILEVWKNGQKVGTRKGRTTSDKAALGDGHFKYGMYGGGAAAPGKDFILYFDDVQIGSGPN